MKTPIMVKGGLPVLGQLLAYISKQDELFRRGAREVGDVFGINLMGQKVAVLTGPEGREAFFAETDRSLNMNQAYDFLSAIFGEVAFLAEHETYLNHRPILHALFSRDRMLAYVGVMVEVVAEWLDHLGERGEIELTEEILGLVKEVAGRCFLGNEINDQLGEEFWKAYDDLSKSLDPVLPPDWPLPKFIRRNRAKRYVVDVLTPLVKERRQHPVDDPFQKLVEVRMKDGQLPSEEVIVQLLMALLFAGHETTAGQAAWTVIQLIQNPVYLEVVRKELADVLEGGKTIDQAALREMKYLKMAVDETSRMRPSAEIIMRTVDEDLQIGDVVIPAGWMVQTAAAVDHFREEVFENPYHYDPTRFSKERREDRREKYAILSFGGGLHTCAGMNFAYNEMMIIASLLFQAYELEILSGNPVVKRGLGSSRPSRTRVRYSRRQL
jgi:sterol 14-demethylase